LPAESAIAFLNPHQMINPEKKVFWRPEQFYIGPTEGPSVPGIIHEIRFWGGYYEMEVKAASQKILIRTMLHGFSKGDTIDISVHPGEFWQL
jgi:ABC-type Fe3+/spermidine/putrescine transport system ATPase subunit